MIRNFIKRVKEQMDMDLTLQPEVTEFVSKKGFDRDYGARPLRRALQTEVEDVLAEAVLAENIVMGSKVVMGVEKKDGKTKVYVQNFTKKG